MSTQATIYLKKAGNSACARIPRPKYNAQQELCAYVHSIESGAAVDGPGMRFALFMSGCQFRCLYCHNPDTWKFSGGKLYTVDEIMCEIAKYAQFLRIAGGLTISGGEPLVQAHFVGEVLTWAHDELGLHTALDTQGFLAAGLDDAWFDPVDLFLLDIKQMNPEKHLRLTSKPLQPCLDFARRTVAMNKKVWLRYVLLPGYTDDEDDVDQLARFAAEMGNVERVEVLPFHKMGEHKWHELGMKYELTAVQPPSPQLTERVRKQFRRQGLFTC